MTIPGVDTTEAEPDTKDAKEAKNSSVNHNFVEGGLWECLTSVHEHHEKLEDADCNYDL
jgi:hypothetical protein